MGRYLQPVATDRKGQADDEAAAGQMLVSKGGIINTIDAAEIARFKSAVQPVYKQAKTDLGLDGGRWIDALTKNG